MLRAVRPLCIGICVVLGALTTKAWAQFDAVRTIERVVNTNIDQALIRVPVKLKVDQPLTPLQQISIADASRRLVALREGNRYEIWALDTGRMAAADQIEGAAITAYAVMPDASVVFGQADGTLSSVAATGRAGDSFKLTDQQPIVALAAHPSTPRVIAAQAGGIISVVDLRGEKSLLRITAGPEIRSIAVDRTGGYVAALQTGGDIGIWDLSTGLRVSLVNVPGSDDAAAFSFGVGANQVLAVTRSGAVVTVETGRASQQNLCKAACNVSSAYIDPNEPGVRALLPDGTLVRWRKGKTVQQVQKRIVVDDPSTVPMTAISNTLIAWSVPSAVIKLSNGDDAAAKSLSLARLQDGWAVVDDSGRFDESSDADDHITWAADNFAIPLGNFRSQYYEPGLLRKLIIGGNDYITKPPSIGQGVLMPPRTEITAIERENGKEQGLLRVSVVADDAGGGLAQVLLYHQGVLVSASRIVQSSETKVDKRVRKEIAYEIPATSGMNWLTSTAENAEGVLSPPFEKTILLQERPQKPTLHILVVGLNKYKITRLDLDYARHDAEEIASTMTRRASDLFSKVQVTKLYDEQVERNSILAALKDLRTAAPEDTIAIYLAGHGEAINNEFYFLGYSVHYPFKLNDMKQYGISFAELAEAISYFDARKIILLFDTCKSGDALLTLDSAEQDQRILGIFGGKVGLHLLAATSKGQLASELGTLGHGIFTYSILEGLSGKADRAPKDGLVSVKELIDYADESVTGLSQQYANFPQQPTSYSRGFDFAIGQR